MQSTEGRKKGHGALAFTIDKVQRLATKEEKRKTLRQTRQWPELEETRARKKTTFTNVEYDKLLMQWYMKD